MKNPLDWLRGKPPKPQRSLHEKVDEIDAKIDDFAKQLGAIHAEMRDKLATLEEPSRAHPGIVSSMPRPCSIGASELEPLEPLAQIEPGDGREAGAEEC